MKYSTAPINGNFESDIIKTKLSEYSGGFSISYCSSNKQEDTISIHGELVEYEVIGNKIKVTYIEHSSSNTEKEITRLYFGPASNEWEVVSTKTRKKREVIEDDEKEGRYYNERKSDKPSFGWRVIRYCFGNLLILIWNITIGLVFEPFKISHIKF